MTSEPPDLNEAISFAVDDGAQAGPFPMSEIIDSVKSGHRSSSTLVWWAGETDWVPFDSIPGLMSHTIPPPPGAPSPEQAGPVESSTADILPPDELLADADADAASDAEVEAAFASGLHTTDPAIGLDAEFASIETDVLDPDVAEAPSAEVETVRWDDVDAAQGTIVTSMFGGSVPTEAAPLAGVDDLLQTAPDASDSTGENLVHPGDDLIEEIIPANAGVFDKSVDPIEVEPVEVEPIDVEPSEPGTFGSGLVESSLLDSDPALGVADLPSEVSGAEFWSNTTMPDIEPTGATGEFDATTPTEQIFEQIEERSPLESVGDRIEALGADTFAVDSSDPLTADPSDAPASESFASDYGQPQDSPLSKHPGLDDLDTSFLTESSGAEEFVETPAEPTEQVLQPEVEGSAPHDPHAPSGFPLDRPERFDEVAAVAPSMADSSVDEVLAPYDEGADLEGAVDSIGSPHVEPAMTMAPATLEPDAAEQAAAATAMSSAGVVSSMMPSTEMPKEVPSDSPVADDEELEALFAEMVTSSWAHYKRVEWATRLDDVMLGGLITSTLDNGYALIDLTSTGTNHFARFEHPDDGSRITMGIEHLTPSATEGEVLGHHASVVIGWGKRVADASTALQGVKDEIKGNVIQTPEPGTVTIDADLTSGYAYTQIDLIWAIENYVARDYTVDHALLSRSVDAAVHSLRKYWYGRFVPASN